MSYEKDYERFLVKLSGTIKELRTQNGYTQEDMVDFGFNYRHYQRLESGSHSPSLSTLFKLSNIFSVEVKDLVR
ncbi:MAG: transcriptional regulator with XRE-family HTH domain [Bacteriovoracaceae bacterium]|jgi:transcriptional regulator with XRE-family HTH domain